MRPVEASERVVQTWRIAAPASREELEARADALEERILEALRAPVAPEDRVTADRLERDVRELDGMYERMEAADGASRDPVSTTADSSDGTGTAGSSEAMARPLAAYQAEDGLAERGDASGQVMAEDDASFARELEDMQLAAAALERTPAGQPVPSHLSRDEVRTMADPEGDFDRWREEADALAASARDDVEQGRTVEEIVRDARDVRLSAEELAAARSNPDLLAAQQEDGWHFGQQQGDRPDGAAAAAPLAGPADVTKAQGQEMQQEEDEDVRGVGLIGGVPPQGLSEQGMRDLEVATDAIVAEEAARAEHLARLGADAEDAADIGLHEELAAAEPDLAQMHSDADGQAAVSPEPQEEAAREFEEIDDTVLTPELADEVVQPSEEAMAAQDAMQAEASTGAEMAAEPGGLEPSGGMEAE